MLRHGIAEERDSQKWPDDSLRPLSSKGLLRTRELVRAYADAGLEAEVIATSPLVRARETAEIFSESMKQPRWVVTPDLAPGGDRERLRLTLPRAVMEKEAALLIGHEPDLSLLLGELLGLPQAPFEFRKGGIAEVKINRAGRGVLRAFLPPRWVMSVD